MVRNSQSYNKELYKNTKSNKEVNAWDIEIKNLPGNNRWNETMKSIFDNRTNTKIWSCDYSMKKIEIVIKTKTKTSISYTKQGNDDIIVAHFLFLDFS